MDRPEAPAAAEGVALPEGPASLMPPQADERPVARPALPSLDTSAGVNEAAGADEATAGASAAAEGTGSEGETAARPPARVHVHVPSGLATSEADRAVAVLGAAGYAPSSRLTVQLTIGSTNIRYYHPEDAEAAQDIAAAITGETGSPAVARDFTDFSPRPAAGTIEVWLAGQSPSGPAAQASQPSPPSTVQRGAQQPQAAAPQRQQPSQPAQQQRRPAPATPQEAAMRELETLADEIARAISRSLRN
jgi:hypothetical protein